MLLYRRYRIRELQNACIIRLPEMRRRRRLES